MATNIFLDMTQKPELQEKKRSVISKELLPYFFVYEDNFEVIVRIIGWTFF